jgi:molybdate transport system ATP-binding protein
MLIREPEVILLDEPFSALDTNLREIFALVWGLPLRLPAPVPNDVTHVGIRAHDLMPVSLVHAAADGTNQIRIAVTQHSEEPFERVLLFTNAGAQNSSEKKEIWWKFSKYLGGDTIPERLYIPSESLLLLHS